MANLFIRKVQGRTGGNDLSMMLKGLCSSFMYMYSDKTLQALFGTVPTSLLLLVGKYVDADY